MPLARAAMRRLNARRRVLRRVQKTKRKAEKQKKKGISPSQPPLRAARFDHQAICWRLFFFFKRALFTKTASLRAAVAVVAAVATAAAAAS